MIPLRDTTQSKNYPVVNSLLIAANVLVFIVQIMQGPAEERFIFLYGLIPARYSVPEISAYFSLGQQWFAFFSFMFLHGGFWHLLGNMWSLYIFGDNVEDRLGPIRYLLFYLLCGWASGLSHLLTNWYSQVPTIGASGAIAGVMGAYLILYPRAKILTLIPLLFIPYFIEIPAYFFLGFWFALQFLNALGSSGGAAGVAWWAHIGGFLFGIILLKVILRVPEFGMTRHLQPSTRKSGSPRLHVVRSGSTGQEPDLHSSLTISPAEARYGTRKVVTVPWGLQSRLFRVSVPPGVIDGTVIRLAGLGRPMPDGARGDLYLQISIGS
jgi:membrane associated rhomboid family serine protease